MKYKWKSLGVQQMMHWCFHHHQQQQQQQQHTQGGTAPQVADPAVEVERSKNPSPSPSASTTGECMSGNKGGAVVRVVGSDGRVRVFKRAVCASEVMREQPCHLICRSDAFLIGQKIPALGPTEQLQPGESYFLLPAHLFHSVLSFVSLASSLLRLLLSHHDCNSNSKKLRPFDIQRTASGTLRITVCDDFLIDKLVNVTEDHGDDIDIDIDAKDQQENEEDSDDEEERRRRRVCSTEKLEKEYEELVGYGKSRPWKPKLDTITETTFSPSSSSSSSSSSAADAHDDIIKRSNSNSNSSRKLLGGSRSGAAATLPLLARLGSRKRRDPLVVTAVC